MTNGYYQNSSENETNLTGTAGTTGTTSTVDNLEGTSGSLKENLKEKVSRQTSEMGERLSQEAEKRRMNATDRLRQTSRSMETWADSLSGSFDWAKEKAASGIRSASQGVDHMAAYMEERDTRAMMEDTKSLIRKYPGKSMVAGLVLGMIVGKILR